MGENASVLYRQLDLAHRILRDKQHSSGSTIDSADFGDSVGLPDVFYVDSGAGSNTNDGRDPAFPLATIDAAINKCTASQGDVILVQPGHAETLTAQISLDVIGVSIIGVGEGTLKPQLTINAVIDGIDIGAANCRVENIGFVASTAGATAQINVDAANATVEKVHFDIGASDLLGTITVTANGEVCTIKKNTVVVSADGADEWVKVEGVVDRLVIDDNDVVASDGSNALDEAIVQCDAVAVTNLRVTHNHFSGGGVAVVAVAGTGLVSPNVKNNTYSGLAIEGLLPTQGVPEDQMVVSTVARTSGGGATDLFIVTGLCLVKVMVGRITSVLTGMADLIVNEKTNSSPFCTITVLDDLAADNILTITGDPSLALNGAVASIDVNYGGWEALGSQFVINDDTIEATWAESGTVGTIAWTIIYIPLEADARIVAA